MNGDFSSPADLDSMPLDDFLHVREGIKTFRFAISSIYFSKNIFTAGFGEKLVENEHLAL